MKFQASISWNFFHVWFLFPRRNSNSNWSNLFYSAETPEKSLRCRPEASEKQKGGEGAYPAHLHQWSSKRFRQQNLTSEYHHQEL